MVIRDLYGPNVRVKTCSRLRGQGHATDVRFTSKEGVVVGVTSEVEARGDDCEDDTVQASALSPKRQASGVMTWAYWAW